MQAQAQRPARELAYGDVKRVELALALASRPRLLLMDEPTAGMAPRERNELISLARRLVQERGISVLFTEHSMDVVFAHAERIIVLARGRLIAQGDAATIQADPKVQETYFGSGRMLARRRAWCWKRKSSAPGTARPRFCSTSRSASARAKSWRSWVATARARPRP